MSKDSRFKYQYRANASNLHKAVGEVLRTDPVFKNHKAYQEYPVNKVNKSYDNGSHKFDWVIPSLLLVIEAHGKQHFDVVAFDGNIDNAVEQFKDITTRDAKKKMACFAAGYSYVMIPYTDEKKIDGNYLFNKIKEADQDLESFVRIEIPETKRLKKKFPKKKEDDQVRQNRLAKAKEVRKKQYSKAKEYKNAIRLHRQDLDIREETNT